ncbi:hypothetical protein RUM43_006642 [Polyplax serrata]|uniref:Uncharacterized protein n=1 Tax=Polyplax serrata TaxID=468196 RepID=A0AAN8PYW8_POLSC
MFSSLNPKNGNKKLKILVCKKQEKKVLENKKRRNERESRQEERRGWKRGDWSEGRAEADVKLTRFSQGQPHKESFKAQTPCNYKYSADTKYLQVFVEKPKRPPTSLTSG